MLPGMSCEIQLESLYLSRLYQSVVELLLSQWLCCCCDNFCDPFPFTSTCRATLQVSYRSSKYGITLHGV